MSNKIKVCMKRKDGAAMIMAICLLALFMVLALAALLSSSALMKRTSVRKDREQAKVMAVSLSQSLEDELKVQGSDIGKYLKRNMTAFNDWNGGTGTWVYYNEEEAFHNDKDKLTKTLDMFNSKGFPDGMSIKISVRWDSSSELSDEAELADRCELIDLKLSVICQYRGQEYRVNTTYGVQGETLDKLSWYIKEGAAS